MNLPEHDPELVELYRETMALTGVVRRPVRDLGTGETIDGRLTEQVASELGLPVEPVLVGPLTPAEMENWRVRLNMPTRRWADGAIRAIIAGFLVHRHGDTDRKVARDLGLPDHKRVGRVRRAMVGALPQVTSRRGRDEKTYPATKHAVIPTRSESEARRVAETVRGMDGVPPGITTPSKLRKEGRKKLLETYARQPVGKLPATISVHHCDFRDLPVRRGTVDLILTDPEWLAAELAEPFAEWAERVLRPGGMAVVYPGHQSFMKWARPLDDRLTWLQPLVSLYEGPGHYFWMQDVRSRHAPLLWFSKGEIRAKGKGLPHPQGIEDVIPSRKEKGFHPKGYDFPLSDALYLIDRLCPRDGLVVDPFCGGGPVPTAAHQLRGGRGCIAGDIDPLCVEITRRRVLGLPL